MWHFGEGMGWWMVFGGLSMVLFWGAIIGLVAWGIKKLGGGSGSGTAGSHTPLDIARERYAKGEISKEEFTQIKKDLS